MIARIKNSWLLLERSLYVLGRNKKLLIFPILTFFSMIVIIAFFLGSFLLQPTGHSYTEKAHWKAVASSVLTADSVKKLEQSTGKRGQHENLQLNQTGLIGSAIAYFIAMFLATFFNVAFYHEIIEALSDRPVSIRHGFQFALSHLAPILMWSLFAGAVGYVIRALERRLGIIGRIVVGIIGVAWSVASVFAIPVIVCHSEVNNPLAILKASALSIKKTWGETLIGFLGLQAGSTIVIFGSAIPFLGSTYLAARMNAPLVAGAAFASWFMFIFLFAYISNVAGNVFQCALYLFASTGAAPSGYTPDMMNLGWKFKKQ